MKEVLNTLLEVTLYSGIIFLILMAIKKALGTKLSPVLHATVWLVLVARLLIPYTFESSAHFYMLPQDIIETQNNNSQTENNAMQSAAGAEDTKSSQTNNDVASNSFVPDRQYDNIYNSDKSLPVIPQTSSSISIDWTAVLFWAWICGIGMFALWIAASMAGLGKRLKNCLNTNKDIQSMCDKIARSLGIRRQIKVFITHEENAPALTASFMPKIILPSSLAGGPNQHVYFALLHELTHYKRCDHLFILLMLALQALYWFNPAVWLARKYMALDMEGACDAAVTKDMDTETSSRYVETLITMAGGNKKNGYALGMALNSSKKIIERRMEGIFSKRSKKSVKLVTLILICALTVTCFTTACQPGKPETLEAQNPAAEYNAGISSPPAIKTEQQPSSSASEKDAWLPQIKTSTDEKNLTVDYTVTYPGAKAQEVYGDPGMVITPAAVFNGNEESIYNSFKACSLINGTRIDPGQTWSFNETLGERTEANGWKTPPETVFTLIAPSGKMDAVDYIASDIYFAAVQYELNVVQVVHSPQGPEYLSSGMNSIVSEDDTDLKIKNDKDYPIYILMKYQGGNQWLQLELLGKDTDKTIDFYYDSKVKSISEDIPQEFEVDNTLPEGKIVKIKEGTKSYVVDIYKYWDDAGKEPQLASTSTCPATPAVYAIGPGTDTGNIDKSIQKQRPLPSFYVTTNVPDFAYTYNVLYNVSVSRNADGAYKMNIIFMYFGNDPNDPNVVTLLPEKQDFTLNPTVDCNSKTILSEKQQITLEKNKPQMFSFDLAGDKYGKYDINIELDGQKIIRKTS
jgi:beta-lactamase regulating signal transducer with metallopeptidase domain